MNKIRVGITGQSGFIGTHLYNRLCLLSDDFICQKFDDSFFSDNVKLQMFVKNCDVIVHLAAVNRSEDEDELYNTNIALVKHLQNACETTQTFPHIIFSSSIQETNKSAYGRSKIDGRLLFMDWANKHSVAFTGLLIPNVFGEFCRPNYNSVIATFAHNLTHDKPVTIITDSVVPFIYVASLCEIICADIKTVRSAGEPIIKFIEVPEDFRMKVSEVRELFVSFKEIYLQNGFIPLLENKNIINLFNTFRSYISLSEYFPKFLQQHSDVRGNFVETIRLTAGGQISFSTTNPGVTRGNHFHTRKIERFTVMHGLAKISLRRVGTTQVYEFILNGNEPSYVDMPVWYTHNITNIGTDTLYTQFWINEWYDQNDPDTFFEEV